MCNFALLLPLIIYGIMTAFTAYKILSLKCLNHKLDLILDYFIKHTDFSGHSDHSAHDYHPLLWFKYIFAHYNATTS